MRIRTQTRTHNQIARSGDIKSFWELVWAGVYKQTGLPMCVCLCPQAIMCGSWRRKSLVSVSRHSKHRSVYLPNYPRACQHTHTHTHTHIPYIYLSMNLYHIVRPADWCSHKWMSFNSHWKKLFVVHSHIRVSIWGSFWMLVRMQLFDNPDFALFHCVCVCVCVVCVCVCARARERERQRETEEGTSTEKHKSTWSLNNSTFVLSNMYLISLSGWQRIVETNPS